MFLRICLNCRRQFTDIAFPRFACSLAKESLARARALRRDRRAGNGTRFGGRWDAVVRRLEAFDRILEFVRNVTAAAVAINARSERLAGHIEVGVLLPAEVTLQFTLLANFR